MKDNEIHQDVQELVGRLVNGWANDGGPREVIGDGLTRDDVLKQIVAAAKAGYLGEDSEALVAHYSTLLSQQPPFRLECGENDEVHLVLTLGNRRVHTWSPVAPETVDAEVVALIGESLKNLARSLTGSDEGEGAGLQRIGTTGGGSVTERVGRMTGMLRRRLGLSNALADWIGEGKSRDELLEMSLPGMPEHAQSVLAAKLNEQPPFSIVCDKDGKIHLELIASGERVHTWTPRDFGLPKPKSWRMIAYPVLGILFLVSLPGNGLFASAMPLVLFGVFDGYLFLRRTRRLVMAWRVYWAIVVLLIVIATQTLSEVRTFALTMAAAMAGSRFAYLWMWVKLFRNRDLLQCQNCGSVMTFRVWADNNYKCGHCGTMAKPMETGQRAGWLD